MSVQLSWTTVMKMPPAITPLVALSVPAMLVLVTFFAPWFTYFSFLFFPGIMFHSCLHVLCTNSIDAIYGPKARP